MLTVLNCIITTGTTRTCTLPSLLIKPALPLICIICNLMLIVLVCRALYMVFLVGVCKNGAPRPDYSLRAVISVTQ